MSKIVTVGVVLAAALAMVGCETMSAGCVSSPSYRIENQRIVLDSPFALEIGSTEYAKAFGDLIQTSAHANYDPQTRKTTTNFYHHAEAWLATPYFGCERVWLNFKGEEKMLNGCNLSRGRFYGSSKSMSFDECRTTVGKIVADMESRFGMTMRCTNDLSENDAKARVKEMGEEFKQEGKKCGVYATGFVYYSWKTKNAHGFVNYNVSGMMDEKGGCGINVDFSVPPEFLRRSYQPGDKIPVYTNEMCSTTSCSMSSKLVPTAEQKKAHEEAKKLRETIVRLFGVDLDQPSETNELSSAIWQTNAPASVKREWTPLEKPFEGMTERKVSQSIRFLAIPFGMFALRHPFNGDVSEAELKAQAKRFLDRLEKEYGAKIPETDTKEGSALLAKRFGEGVPTYGDTKTLLGLDKKTHFMGQVGDLAIEIGYAEPRYAKRGGKYEIACKGAVVVNIVQSPVVTTAKAKK